MEMTIFQCKMGKWEEELEGEDLIYTFQNGISHVFN